MTDDTTIWEAIEASAAQASQQEAIDRVEKHAHKAWFAGCIQEGERLAALDGEFIAADVRDGAEAKMVHRTHEPKAMGAVMGNLRRSGLIERTGRMTGSGGKRDNNRDSKVWRGKR